MAYALDLANAYIEAWNDHDGAGIAAMFAEGGTYTDPLAPPLTGEAIISYAEGLWKTLPDLSFVRAGTFVASSSMVAVQWLMKGTNTGPFEGFPPTGGTVALHGADFIQVDGGRIRSVTGYFDAGEIPRQLGLQVIVQPRKVGPFSFGWSTAVQGGKNTKSGAVSITSIQVSSHKEVEQIREYSKNTALEMLGMPGLIGWTGMVIGRRMLTVTAWEDSESP